jgi:hypothetical protein
MGHLLWPAFARRRLQALADLEISVEHMPRDLAKIPQVKPRAAAGPFHQMIGFGFGGIVSVAAGVGHPSGFSFRFPQCVSLRSRLNSRTTWRFSAPSSSSKVLGRVGRPGQAVPRLVLLASLVKLSRQCAPYPTQWDGVALESARSAANAG